MPIRRNKFLTVARKKWMARTFQGLFLLVTAASVGDTFLKLSDFWRFILIVLAAFAFGLGLYFSQANTKRETEE